MMKFDFSHNDRLKAQLEFIIEVDKVKNIYRQSLLFDASRFENDAEHSWTIALMAVLLREYANFDIDIEKAVTMLLLHDIVEIDAGDTFLYSPDRANAAVKEEKAAQRIFGMLEDDQKERFINIWREFEAKETNEAKFAGVFDRLEPMLQNYITEGKSWKKHGVTYEMAVEKNSVIKYGSEQLWEFAFAMLNDAAEKGYLPRQR